ncbi:MAG: hypothetical protein F6J87_26925 [Spirulina sp. SIO3F2]|nr:hypothetical protein [Spirulina sp. SIO3F2]
MVWRHGLATGAMVLLVNAPMGGARANETPTEATEAIAEQDVQSESATAAQLHQAALERYRMGETQAGKEQLEQALELYRAQGDRLGEATLLLDLSGLSVFDYNLPATLKTAEAALHIAQTLENSELIAQAWFQIGNHYLVREELDAAQNAYQQSLDIARAAGDRPGEGRALVGLGATTETDAQAAQPGLALIQDTGTPRDEAIALLQVAYFYGHEPDSPETLDMLMQSLAKFQEAGDRALFQEMLTAALYSLDEQTELLAVVQAALQQQLAIAQANNATLFEIDLLHHLGYLAKTDPNNPVTLPYYQQALSLGQAENNGRSVMFSLRLLGEFYGDQNNLSQAQDYYEQGFRVAQALDDRQSANEFLRSIGQLGWQGGRQEFLDGQR